jgi:protein-S-isoprenylcysteine O-methyltransferase Ste14
MTAANDQKRPREGINKGRLIGFLVALPAYFALFMFLPAGTWAWTQGWLFIGVFLVTLALLAVVLWRVNPEVVVARTGLHEGTKRWDKILVPILLAVVYSIIPVAALDDGRFHWLPLPLWIVGVGYALFLIGIGIVAWAEAVNKFFEVTVRIQTDRGHKVIDTGPYAIVRHPGYVGGILFFVGTALCLKAVWALVPAGLACAVLILRTRWEDQTLQAELPGYKEYTQRVRYKLIPGVW